MNRAPQEKRQSLAYDQLTPSVYKTCTPMSLGSLHPTFPIRTDFGLELQLPKYELKDRFRFDWNVDGGVMLDRSGCSDFDQQSSAFGASRAYKTERPSNVQLHNLNHLSPACPTSSLLDPLQDSPTPNKPIQEFHQCSHTPNKRPLQGMQPSLRLMQEAQWPLRIPLVVMKVSNTR